MGLVVFVGGYLWLARGRPDHLPAHQACFGAGVLVLWLALETPVDTVSDHYLQSVHMAQHVLLGVVAPPLLLLGLSPSMATWLARGVPSLTRLAAPVPAQVLSGAVMVAWHLPWLYDATLVWEPLHVVEHLTLIGSGLLFWWPILEATAATLRWRLGDGGKLIYMFAGTFAQDGVALVLQFSRATFYDFYNHAPRLLPQLSPVIDQNLAGVVLMVGGKTSFAVAMLVVFFRWMNRERDGRAAPLVGGRL